MKNVAIITEYNPFHKGHGIQIEEIKKMLGGDVRIIAIMSGNTVQRGEVALFEKGARAKAAVLHGVNAVFELPFPYSCACAEIFASAAISIAQRLGNVDHLVFGSESGDISYLQRVAERLSSDELAQVLDEISKKERSLPYFKRRERAYELLYKEELSKAPNDILGIEYLRALSGSASNIIPMTYKRQEGYSAGRTRQEIKDTNESSGLDEIARDVFDGVARSDGEKLGELLLQYLRRADILEVQSVFDMPMDLGAKMKQESLKCARYEDFMHALKGTGYTDARIKRELLYLWCGVKDMGRTPEYTSLLAFDEVGREYLSSIRKTSKIPILTKSAHYKSLGQDGKRAFEEALSAESLFAYSLNEPVSVSDMMKKGPWIKEGSR
ncbi:MAG: nucleotidyltransferase family protein [Clostridia bacterium]|nr:nucleotidyltransferase family protein [Clostridia bacterium]